MLAPSYCLLSLLAKEYHPHRRAGADISEHISATSVQSLAALFELRRQAEFSLRCRPGAEACWVVLWCQFCWVSDNTNTGLYLLKTAFAKWTHRYLENTEILKAKLWISKFTWAGRPEDWNSLHEICLRYLPPAHMVLSIYLWQSPRACLSLTPTTYLNCTRPMLRQLASQEAVLSMPSWRPSPLPPRAAHQDLSELRCHEQQVGSAVGSPKCPTLGLARNASAEKQRIKWEQVSDRNF